MAGRSKLRRLEDLKERQAQIEAQMRALAAQAAADNRRRDTRARCVLAGAVIALLRREADVRAGLCKAFLARAAERDRRLVAGLLQASLGDDTPPLVAVVAGGGE
jgi:hypothetical protein